MQELEQELTQRGATSRLELLRNWLTQHRVPATAYAVVVGAVLLASGYFAYSSLNQASQQTEVQARIERLGGIAAISPQRLAEVTKENERVLASMPASDLKETAVYQAVLDMVAPESVEVQINYRGDSQTKVGETSYRVMQFTMNVSGPDDLVWSLLKQMDAAPKGLGTLVLTKVSLNTGTVTTVSANFVVYTNVPGA